MDISEKLRHSAIYGNMQEVEDLLQQGADPNEENQVKVLRIYGDFHSSASEMSVHFLCAAQEHISSLGSVLRSRWRGERADSAQDKMHHREYGKTEGWMKD